MSFVGIICQTFHAQTGLNANEGLCGVTINAGLPFISFHYKIEYTDPLESSDEQQDNSRKETNQ